jgi:hypothetical protein
VDVIRHAPTGRMIRPGGLRYPGGWLPEVGTIVGPHDGEFLTVVAHEAGRALLSPSTSDDFTALRDRDDARSPAELDLMTLKPS